MTHVKGNLLSFPTCFMLIFTIPISLTNRLEKVQRDYLWGGLVEEFNYHLMVGMFVHLFDNGVRVRRLSVFN